MKKPLESLSAAEAYERVRQNKLRRYPSPDRDGGRLYPLASPSARPSFTFGKNDTVFTIGSCFARNVEAALEEVGMTVTSREANLGKVGDSLGFAGNFFNKYSIHSILNELRWALEPETFPGEDIVYRLKGKNNYADLQLGMAKLEFPLRDIMEFRARYNKVMARAAQADVVIITLGYVETWYDTKLGIYLNGSPPQPLVKAEPERFEFRVLDYNDILGGLRDIHTLLLKHRSKPLKMLVTVSPVPLLSTFRDMDVLVANTYSKSVQRAAIEEFVRDAEGVDYFPSYEFVMLSNPTVAWSRGDYRHVSPDLVTRIMSNVVTSYVPGGSENTGSAGLTPEALLSSVRMMFKLEKFDEVVALREETPEAFENNPDVLALVGNAYARLGNQAEAFEVFSGIIELSPARPNYLERTIGLCRPLRKIDEARALLKLHGQRFPGRTEFRDRVDWT